MKGANQKIRKYKEFQLVMSSLNPLFRDSSKRF
jgi:hypothetical protein